VRRIVKIAGACPAAKLRFTAMSIYREAAAAPPLPRCPRDGEVLDQVTDPVARLVCPRCDGCWMRAAEVVKLVLSSQVQATFAGDDDRPRAFVKDTSRPLHCLDCSVRMVRYQYGGESRVAVDCCQLHGLWLDGHELVQIAAYLRLHAAELAPVLPSEQAKLESRALRGPGPYRPPTGASDDVSVSSFGWLDVLAFLATFWL
jgi:Zn-finger nucleic acid-binding protein